MEIDLTQNDLITLLVLVEQEIERGAAAFEARDLDACLNAFPPRALRPLQSVLQSAIDS